MDNLETAPRGRLDDMHRRIDDIENDVSSHAATVDRHLGEHRVMLEGHIENFRTHKIEETRRHELFLDSQIKNTQAITALTKNVSGVIQVYETANSLSKFVRWVAGLIIAVSTVVYYLEFLG